MDRFVLRRTAKRGPAGLDQREEHVGPSPKRPKPSAEQNAEEEGEDEPRWGTEVANISSNKRKKSANEPHQASSSSMQSKAPPPEAALKKHANQNEQLTSLLAEMGRIERSKGQMHRARAYERAVRSLRNHSTTITSGTEAQKLEGIGKKIGLKIDEILSTGKLGKLETLNADPKNKALHLIQQISGFGPVAAQRLVEEHGVTSLEDLEKLKQTFTHHQRIGLKYFHDFNQRIPRSEMIKLGSIVEKTLEEVDNELMGTTCGSFRRGAEFSGDVTDLPFL